MNENEKKLRNECIERLRILEKNFGLMQTVRKEFEKDGTLYYSEANNLGGILYWVDNEENFTDYVKEFEKNNDVKVYFCLRTFTDFGELFDMLYVSIKDEDYWEDEKAELQNGYAISNCINVSDEYLSEMGDIAFVGKTGGIVRVS